MQEVKGCEEEGEGVQECVQCIKGGQSEYHTGAHWGKDFSNIDSVQLCNKSVHSR